MDYERLAKFPIQNEDDWILTIVIGGVLLFLGFLLVPVLAVWGYVAEVIRGGVAGESEPPTFDDWGTLVVDGLKGFIILAVYQIPPAIVGGGLILVFGLASAGTDSAGLGFVGFLLGFGVWSLLGLVFGYFGMAGFANFAVEDSIGAGFDVGTIMDVATSGGWLMAWVFYIALSIVAGLVASFTGGLAGPFTSFYALTAGGRAFGEAFADATGVEAAPAEATAPA